MYLWICGFGKYVRSYDCLNIRVIVAIFGPNGKVNGKKKWLPIVTHQWIHGAKK